MTPLSVVEQEHEAIVKMADALQIATNTIEDLAKALTEHEPGTFLTVSEADHAAGVLGNVSQVISFNAGAMLTLQNLNRV